MEIGGSCDLFYAITSKLDILVGYSGQILAGAISTKFDSDSISFRRPISSCFSKRELRTINFSHVTKLFRFCWSYYIFY